MSLSRREERGRNLPEPGQVSSPDCSHLDQIQNVTPSAEGCEDCLNMGGRWVHLRICLVCGHVGCCDNSPNTHATRHYHDTQHALIQSFEPNEDWIWCFVDEALIAP
jgi:uncharacterized UBP type Zn finger protein